MLDKANVTTRWYREPMAVLVFALPGIAVIASSITLWIALTHVDALVASDYYQQGLSINRSMARDHAAIRAGLSATVEFQAETVASKTAAKSIAPKPAHDDGSAASVTVRITGCETAPCQQEVPVLKLIHPFDAARDQSIILQPGVDGALHGVLPPLDRAVHWHLNLETSQWHLMAEAGFTETTPSQLIKLHPFAMPQ